VVADVVPEGAEPEADADGAPAVPATPPVVDVHDLDWDSVRAAADAPAIRARMLYVVQQMEALLDAVGGPGMLFDADREHAGDRAIRIAAVDAAAPLWIIGDLHGDLLALEAALAQIRAHGRAGRPTARRRLPASSSSATSSTTKASASRCCSASSS
jgi:hypothetical protein